MSPSVTLVCFRSNLPTTNLNSKPRGQWRGRPVAPLVSVPFIERLPQTGTVSAAYRLSVS